jgi:hypothetical protein
LVERGFTVETDLFEVSTPGKHFINPRCFGEDFARWLSERLKARGLSPSEPIQEDWGWVLVIPYQSRTFTLSIGVMDDSIGQNPAEWRVGIAYEKLLNGLWALFRPRPTTELSHLAGVLEEGLRSEPRILRVTPA